MVENLTRHASSRIRQRGYREQDVDVILDNGTPTQEGVLLTSRDVAERIADCRRRIATLERLRGSAVFLEEGHVVSVYRPSITKVRRMIRHGRGRQKGAALRSGSGRPGCHG